MGIKDLILGHLMSHSSPEARTVAVSFPGVADFHQVLPADGCVPGATLSEDDPPQAFTFIPLSPFLHTRDH